MLALVGTSNDSCGESLQESTAAGHESFSVRALRATAHSLGLAVAKAAARLKRAGGGFWQPSVQARPSSAELGQTREPEQTLTSARTCPQAEPSINQ